MLKQKNEALIAGNKEMVSELNNLKSKETAAKKDEDLSQVYVLVRNRRLFPNLLYYFYFPY